MFKWTNENIHLRIFMNLVNENRYSCHKRTSARLLYNCLKYNFSHGQTLRNRRIFYFTFLDFYSDVYPQVSKLPYHFWFKVWECVSREKCKTQNSGLRSKEEKPPDPISQSSRCNTQEGLLSAAQTGDSDLLGGRAPRTANWASFLYAKKKKKHTISILHTGYKVIGYTFVKQSYWHKLRGLWFKLKAILLVQTARAFVQT